MQTLADWLAHLEGLHPKGQAGIEQKFNDMLTGKAGQTQAIDGGSIRTAGRRQCTPHLVNDTCLEGEWC